MTHLQYNMKTEYAYRATICAPTRLISQANQLACIVGENPADIGTFTGPTHTKDGEEWSCISTVVKPIVPHLAGLKMLPDPLPPHAIGLVDPVEAQSTLDSLNEEGGLVADFILLYEDGIPLDTESISEIYTRLGFEFIPEPDEQNEEHEG